MKAIKYFVWVTAALSFIGSILLVNDGEYDMYTLWNTTALCLAGYYMHKRE